MALAAGALSCVLWAPQASLSAQRDPLHPEALAFSSEMDVRLWPRGVTQTLACRGVSGAWGHCARAGLRPANATQRASPARGPGARGGI